MNKSTFTALEKKRPELKKVKSYQYAKDAILGNGIFSKYIILAAERFINDLQRDDLIFDLDVVEKVNVFFGEIIYVPELKRPIEIQPYRAFLLEQLFGFFYKKQGIRRFSSCYYQVGRKSLKTFDAAGITLYEGLFGNESDAEIMVGANSRDQAIICTVKIGKIIDASPELLELKDDGIIKTHTYKQKTTSIIYKTEDRIFRIDAMPKEPGDGENPHVTINDELHESNSLRLIETGESGQALRPEALNVVITSPGHNKTGPCYTELRKNSIEVLNGKYDDDRHLALLYEMDSEKEVDNIIKSIDLRDSIFNQLDKVKLLEKSNPAKPHIKGISEYLVSRMKKAKKRGGYTAANIKIKNGGVWIDAPKIWIPSSTIKANNHGITKEQLIGKKCYAGMDLSAGKDLNAFVLEFEEIDGIIPVLSYFWIPQEKIDNQKNDAVDYRKFVEDGHMEVFDGNVVEYNVIAERIAWELEKFDCISIGCDAKYLYTGPVSIWNTQGKQDIIEKIVPVGQGFNLTGATEQIEQWTTLKRMDFMGNPVMEMCFANTTLHLKDSGNVQEGGISGHKYPAKGKSSGRIDGVIGLVTAEYERQRLQAEPIKPTPKIEVW